MTDIAAVIAARERDRATQAEGDPGCAKGDDSSLGYRDGCPGCRWIKADVNVQNAGGPASVLLARVLHDTPCTHRHEVADTCLGLMGTDWECRDPCGRCAALAAWCAAEEEGERM